MESYDRNYCYLAFIQNKINIYMNVILYNNKKKYI